MKTRTQIVQEVAKAIKDKGLDTSIKFSDFDKYDLGITARQLRRRFGNFSRAMYIIMKAVGKLPETVKREIKAEDLKAKIEEAKDTKDQDETDS